MKALIIFAISSFISTIRGESADGPFVLWGVPMVQRLKSPALHQIDDNILLQVYDETLAAVVAKTDDCNHLRSAEKLKKIIGDNFVSLPNHALPITPNIFINDTQFITLSGSDSEMDAQVSEVFQQMENKYGQGNVLGILGTNCPDAKNKEVDVRTKRDIPPDANLKEAPVEVFYNAPDKILLYASDYPVLKYSGGENGTGDEIYKLKTVADVSSDDRGQLSRLIVIFSVETGKVTLRFRFPNSTNGYWEIGSVELVDLRGNELLLTPKPMPAFLGAPVGFSFRCYNSIIFTNGSISLEIKEIQVQPQLNGAKSFSSAYNCVGFTTGPIWSGLVVTWLLTAGLFTGISMIMSIRTMDRFENSKGKMLTITVYE